MVTIIEKLFYYFKQLKKILNANQLKLVYRALIESLLTFGIIAWGSVNTANLHNLQIAQNNMFKIILDKNYIGNSKS
jgi:hypothetical protein